MTEHRSSSLRGGIPSGSPASYTSKEEITSLLRGTAPAAVSASGQSYVDLANAYDQAMTDLRKFAHDLADAWKGPASNAAQHQLRDLFAAAFEISSRSAEVGNAVKTHGTSYLAWYQQSMPTPKTVDEARQWMQGANARTTQTWNAVPADISTGLPETRPTESDYGSPVSAGGPTGERSSTGSGAPGHERSGRVSGSAGSQETGSGAHGSAAGPSWILGGANIGGSPGIGGGQQFDGRDGTDLAGLGTSGGASGLPGSGPSGGAGPGGGLGAGGGPAGSGLPGGVAGGGGGVSGGATGVGPGLLPGAGGPGAAPARGATGGTAPAGRPGAPGVGFPGGSGRGGDGSREHNRRTWLGEQDIWYDDREVAPGVIGEVASKPTEPEKTSDDEPTEQEALLRKVLARLERLESRDTATPAADERRIEWTD
ncbi:WXG100 family type VII secretion target [Actinomadura bangladeshensis]|uniref:PPE domain-containing protein n=1 Tax=Actinomadura bangladeshensis TaxID=453573 RepID=A0A6L9QPB3_9ACTN|nr:hypothetical protein [Actinomadura bangladeshensis]NEA27350.1 hypothetical protein [Actinomadura bangladeshensis]